MLLISCPWCGVERPEIESVRSAESQEELFKRALQETQPFPSGSRLAILEDRGLPVVKRPMVPGPFRLRRIEGVRGRPDAEIADAFEFAKSSPFPVPERWDEVNFAHATPVADRLLTDVEATQNAVIFDGDQADAIPKPY